MLYDPYIRHHYWIEEANGTTKQIFTLGDAPQLCINAFTETPFVSLAPSLPPST